MGDQDIELARRGETGAIAQLIQQAILTKAVRVKVLQQNSNLQVFLVDLGGSMPIFRNSKFKIQN